MKQIFIAMLLAATTSTYAQQIDLGDLPPGREKTVVLMGDYNNAIGDMIIKKVDKERSGIAFDFSKSGATHYLLKVIKDNIVVHSQKVAGGPAGDFELTYEPFVAESWISDNSPDWWWGVLLVAYCCLELEVSQTTNSDGTSSVTGTIAFDCDCFSISNLVTTEGGSEIAGVTEIQVTPLY